MGGQRLTYSQKVVESAMSIHTLLNTGMISKFLGFVFGLIFAPLIVIDEKRIEKFETNKEADNLLSYISLTTYKGKLWDKACHAMSRLGVEGYDKLISALSPDFVSTVKTLSGRNTEYRTSPHLRASAAYCLGLIGDKKAIPELEKAMKDSDEKVRAFAEEAIEDIRDSN